METEINIVEILKDKPQGTKLYSSACGKCRLEEVDDKSFKISFYNSKFGLMNGGEGYLDKNGKLYDDGECVVFPSKEMRDWSKFAWKKGDVLVSNDGGTEVIFDKWYDDTYTNFYGRHYLNSEEKNNVKYNETFLCTTERYALEDKNAAKTYLKTIEERLGRKLNLETWEIEKPKFKNGDIVALVVQKCTHIAIFQSRQGAYIGFHAVLCQNDELLLEEPFREDVGDIELRLATDSEKQQLFDALAKEGKVWDAEKKQIVDLSKKCEFKPMDWCLMRDIRGEECFAWSLCQFAYQLKRGKYEAVGGMRFDECIPYNEETAHLLGTTDEWKGGEG
ncbi:hypothetical protein [Segatella copri]|uniref:Uncharacterized protein n=1 Tax=Segatella copri TaxID=165179 RepID=A0A414YGL5_9BACT|nr:hypothetical protein [Segatella copri]RHH85236.1 hypothetical protein DW192_00450 [Segatella copri]